MRIVVALAYLLVSALSAPADAPHAHVYLVIVDGLAARLADAAHMPRLFAAVAHEPAHSSVFRGAHAVMPARTNPNHVTLLTGAYAEAHGITGNAYWSRAPGAPPELLEDAARIEVETLFTVAETVAPSLGTLGPLRCHRDRRPRHERRQPDAGAPAAGDLARARAPGGRRRRGDAGRRRRRRARLRRARGGERDHGGRRGGDTGARRRARARHTRRRGGAGPPARAGRADAPRRPSRLASRPPAHRRASPRGRVRPSVRRSVQPGRGAPARQPRRARAPRRAARGHGRLDRAPRRATGIAAARRGRRRADHRRPPRAARAALARRPPGAARTRRASARRRLRSEPALSEELREDLLDHHAEAAHVVCGAPHERLRIDPGAGDVGARVGLGRQLLDHGLGELEVELEAVDDVAPADSLLHVEGRARQV